MDPEEQKLLNALITADKAGDTKGAGIIADLIQKRRASMSKGPAGQQQRDIGLMEQKIERRNAPPPARPTAPPAGGIMRTPSGAYVESPAVEKPEDTLEGFLKTTGYALAPYVAAGGAGAGAGAMLGGLPAIPGAIAGVGSVLLGDIASGLYNAVVPQFGGQPMQSPSQLIRNTMVTALPGQIAPPETPAQRMLYGALDVGAGSVGGAAALKQAANLVRPGVTQNVMRTLGGGTPGVNLAAGVGAGLAGQTARELNAPSEVQVLAELLGGITGGGTAAGFNAMRRGGVAGMRPDQAQLTQEAVTRRNQLYTDMENAGVRYNKSDISKLLKDFEKRAKTGLIPGLASAPPELKNALTLVRAQLKTGTAGVSGPRQLLEIIDTFESAAKGGRMPVLAGEFRRMVDDFMADATKSVNVKKAATPADVAAAKAAVQSQNALRTQATEAAQRVYRAEQFDPVVEKIAADIANGVNPAKAVQTNLRTLAKNTEFMRFATPTQKAAVMAAVQGDLPQNILRAIGSFSPGSPGLRGQLGQILTYGGMGAGLAAPLFAPAVLAPVVGGAIGAGTSAARQAANVSAEASLNRLGELLKTGAMPPKPASSQFGRSAARAATIAAAQPDESESARIAREQAKPKEKQLILGAPKNDKEVQRMARVARDMLDNPEYASRYKLAEVAQLYRTLFNASQEGYDLGELADRIADLHEYRYATEQGAR